MPMNIQCPSGHDHPNPSFLAEASPLQHTLLNKIFNGRLPSLSRQAGGQTDGRRCALAPTLEELTLGLNLAKMFILNILVDCSLIW